MSLLLKNFRVARFRLDICPAETLCLPAYKGATFRGGFGYAFKRVICSTRTGQCDECILKERCIYAYIFETPLPPDAVMMRKYPQVPHPFVIEPPEEARTVFPAGETVSLHLVLIGRAIDFLPYFVYTFEELGQRGLGARRTRYAVTGVHVVGPGTELQSIYSAGERKLRTDFRTVSFEEITAHGVPAADVSGVSLTFLTPTRLRFAGSITSQLTFDMVIRNLLRRVSALSYFHCGEELKTDFRGWIQRACEIRLDKSSLAWHDWERYSTRQRTRMSLGGFVGRVLFTGEVGEFLPLLRLGEFVHLGKGATFGLGKYTVECIARRPVGTVLRTDT